MFWNRGDKMFIAAATDDVQFEKLLWQYRCLRACLFGYLMIVIVVCLVLMVWLGVDIFHLVRTHTFQPTPKWLFARQASELLMQEGIVVFSVIVSVLVGLYADQMVKLLLLFRTLKNGNPSRRQDGEENQEVA